MGLTSIPTETSGSLGTDKIDRYPRANEIDSGSAAEWNTMKRAVAELAAAVGLEDGSTADSLEARTVERWAYKTEDEARNTTATLASDTHLSVALTPGVWAFRATLIMTTNSGDGARVAMGGSLTAAHSAYSVAVVNNADESMAPALAGLSLGGDLAYSTLDGSIAVALEGTVEVSAAGTLAVQWAQHTSGGTDLTAHRGSVLHAKRISA